MRPPRPTAWRPSRMKRRAGAGATRSAGCGSMAMLGNRPAFADPRSVLSADYRPWPFTVFGSVDPGIIEEAVLDQQRYPDTFVEPVLPTVIPGGFWPTPSPTPILT